MRLDHWIKQLFVLPGILVGYLLLDLAETDLGVSKIIIAMVSACSIASANYVINEYLDAQFDKFHPVKKNRTAVLYILNGKAVFCEYMLLGLFGLFLAHQINRPFFVIDLLFLLSGIFYNVRPFRMKDIAFVDVLLESLNNMLRFLLGWFILTDVFLPPASVLLGYWLGGSFLMAMKRFSEYRMIADKEMATAYRKSFGVYSERSLLISSLFYAMCSSFFIGIFLVKYKIELILFIPFVIILFCYYFGISFEKDSEAQKPEKLYKDKFLMGYSLFLLVLFFVLINVDINILHVFDGINMTRI